MNTMTKRVTAFLSVYGISRHYGGPEEGGWWYDAKEHLGPAFPYEATQEFHRIIVEDPTDERPESPYPTQYDQDEGCYYRWEPSGLPEPLDLAQANLLELITKQYELIYGKPGTGHRFSVSPRAEDHIFIHELHPGEYETKGRPHYE